MPISCTDADFTRLFEQHGAAEAARILGIAERNVYKRRTRVEARTEQSISAPSKALWKTAYPDRIPYEIKNGVALVMSDQHYWPGIISTAHRGAVKLAKELQPQILISNGDAWDGAKSGRHPAIGWERKPNVNEEKETIEERYGELRDAAPDADLYWMLGNHDMRFENKLANTVSEMDGVKGFSLCDHFPDWEIGMSIWINGDTVIKHRYRGGVHATHNNAVYSGKSMVTGHLHALKVTPFDDYNGTRFGVDTGTLADPFGPQFKYSEDNPNNHRSGFVILTFHEGKLLWPEIVAVMDEKHIQFRGQVIEV